MRFYAVGNMYLSSIQQGIQAAHCLGEFVLKYNDDLTVNTWLAEYKTIICLNGGNNKALTEFYNYIVSLGNYPVAKFHEDDQSLGGLLTCVGVLVPEKIYDNDVDLNDPDTYEHLTASEVQLIATLKRMPLAR